MFLVVSSDTFDQSLIVESPQLLELPSSFTSFLRFSLVPSLDDFTIVLSTETTSLRRNQSSFVNRSRVSLVLLHHRNQRE